MTRALERVLSKLHRIDRIREERGFLSQEYRSIRDHEAERLLSDALQELTDLLADLYAKEEAA